MVLRGGREFVPAGISPRVHLFAKRSSGYHLALWHDHCTVWWSQITNYLYICPSLSSQYTFATLLESVGKWRELLKTERKPISTFCYIFLPDCPETGLFGLSNTWCYFCRSDSRENHCNYLDHTPFALVRATNCILN